VDAEELIADLDPDQRLAVTADSHLVAVIAGAGSGKTRVLTRRVAYRIATGDADARHTMVLTFTREAAGELRRRLHRLGLREHIEAGTFHSVMLSILRQRWADTDRPTKTVVPDRRRLLRDALADSPHRSRRDLESAHVEIDWAAARGISPEGYESLARRDGRRPVGGVEQAVEALRAYEQLKRRRGVIDFDDVLLHVLDDARSDPEFASTLRWRFRHLLVDEAQDLNPVQHRLIDLLRSGRDDLFLVGDPSQAIYGFNGADPRVLTEVETTFPGIEIVRLPVNHRCTPQVVDAGRHALSMAGPAPSVRARRHDGRPVTIHEADDETAEAEFVAHQIARGDPNLVRSGQIAVLARTNAQLRPFEVALADAGVGVRRRSNAKGSPMESALRRATDLSSPSALRAWAHDTLDDLDALTSAEGRVERLDELRSQVEPTGPGRSPSNRPRRPDAAAVAEAKEDLAIIRAERRVANALLDFLRDRPRGDGAEFRGWVATSNPFDDASNDGVELLTFHAAKGREWHTVFVTGVESSLVPHRSATTAEAKAEEARLLYVAMTRAGDALTLTAAQRRGGYARKLSPFIADIDLSEPEALPPPIELIRKTREAAPIHLLKKWRADAARRSNVLPPQLVSDSDLSAIARHRPHTAEELAEVTSMGPITARRLAPEILDALS
jgi:ATP-dependent DNA helicase UvrD/PcrA